MTLDQDKILPRMPWLLHAHASDFSDRVNDSTPNDRLRNPRHLRLVWVVFMLRNGVSLHGAISETCINVAHDILLLGRPRCVHEVHG